jgi:hypothetical protein
MKVAPSVFGILFISISGYLMWNHFELPTILWGETGTVKGTVEKIDLIPGYKGSGVYQKTYYFYIVNDSNYKDNFIADKRHGIQKIGDKLSIEYSKNNPSKNKVVGFYNKN